MQPISITHQHVLAITSSQAERFSPGATIKVLDAGCGNGAMIQYLQTVLPEVCPQFHWEVYGYDVADHGVQTDPDFMSGAVRHLNQALPEVQWEHRIATISSGGPWPNKDASFDVIVSNQVVEHLNRPAQFFSELHRCLTEDGFSAHVYPVKTQMFEGHIRVPFAHRIMNHGLLTAWIKFWNHVGFGRFKTYNQPGDSFQTFCEKEADRITYYTRYMTCTEFLQMAKDLNFRPSFRFIQDVYFAKLRSVLRMKPKLVYSARRNNFLDWCWTQLLKYGMIMTLFLEKKNTVLIKYADASRTSSLAH